MTEYDRRRFLTQAAGGLAALSVLPELGLARVPSRSEGLKVAVVGAGRQGRAILGELGKLGVSVAAVCDVDQRRLASGVRRASGAEGFASVDDLLSRRPDIEAVAIATPTPTHRAVAERVLEAGKHVYLECPLAHTVEDCAAIAAAARASARTIAAGLQGRANPVYKLARTFYRTDAIRDLVAIRAQQNEKTSWRTAARDPARERALNWRLDPEVTIGLAGEWGTQQFDVVHWYVGRYPETVRGSGDIRLHDDGRRIHDTVACTFRFADGADFQYSATLANSFEGAYEVFYGSNSAIKLSWSHGWMFKEADSPRQGWEVYANRQQFHNDEGITLIADATKLASQGRLQEGIGLPYSSLYYALADWITSIEEGTTPSCSIGEAARATAVGIAAHQATVTGDEVAIDFSALT